jgi:hypothetical protein
VSVRLNAEDLARSTATKDTPSPIPAPSLRTIYVFSDEALYEASNDTIHALLHVGVWGTRGTLTVYVKWRGFRSRMYMAAIRPARRLVLYPAMVKKVEDVWRKRAAEGALPGNR